jgi:hypothetical protein
MHVGWPRAGESVPVMTRAHNPYDDEELESSPLAWDTQKAFISQGDLVGLGLITDAAQPLQGSYWPNEPPVLPPSGHYWYNYGPLGRGMYFWKTLPIGQRPSPEEQAADLVKHRQEFAWGKVPAGLEEALAQHGLSLQANGQGFLIRNLESIVIGSIVLGIVGMMFPRRK